MLNKIEIKAFNSPSQILNALHILIIKTNSEGKGYCYRIKISKFFLCYESASIIPVVKAKTSTLFIIHFCFSSSFKGFHSY